MKYNLGKGKKGLNGFVNLDKKDLDLNNSFILKDCDKIIMDNVLEHIDNRYECIISIHSSLSKGKSAIITLPVFNSNLSHKSYFHFTNFFDVVSRTNDNSLQNKKLFDVTYKLKFNDWKHIYYVIKKLLYIVFVSEIEFKLIKK